VTSVRFTVRGSTLAELDDQASERLASFDPARPADVWCVAIDAREEIVTVSGEVRSWKGDVTADDRGSRAALATPPLSACDSSRHAVTA
jgi:hypothetical protein